MSAVTLIYGKNLSGKHLNLGKCNQKHLYCITEKWENAFSYHLDDLDPLTLTPFDLFHPPAKLYQPFTLIYLQSLLNKTENI